MTFCIQLTRKNYTRNERGLNNVQQSHVLFFTLKIIPELHAKRSRIIYTEYNTHGDDELGKRHIGDSHHAYKYYTLSTFSIVRGFVFYIFSFNDRTANFEIFLKNGVVAATQLLISSRGYFIIRFNLDIV